MVLREEDVDGEADNHSLASGSDVNVSWVRQMFESDVSHQKSLTIAFVLSLLQLTEGN